MMPARQKAGGNGCIKRVHVFQPQKDGHVLGHDGKTENSTEGLEGEDQPHGQQVFDRCVRMPWSSAPADMVRWLDGVPEKQNASGYDSLRR
jgi:hypothetical protein